MVARFSFYTNLKTYILSNCSGALSGRIGWRDQSALSAQILTLDATLAEYVVGICDTLL